MGLVGEFEGILKGPSIDDATLREALAAGGVGAWSWDRATGAVAADETARRLWGLPPQGALTAAQLLAAIHPDDVEHARRFGAPAPGGRRDVQAIVRVASQAGENRWVRLRSRVDGDRLVGVVIDVTERMRAETHLSATEARLRRAQELGGAEPFEWDAATDSVVAGPGYNALFGLGPDERMTLDVFLSRVHPDDRRRVEDDQHRLLDAPRAYESEFRIVLPDGGMRWLLSRGEGVRAPDGTVTGIAGVLIDITSRRQVEDELRRTRREARGRFRELRALYNNAPIGLALLDADLRFVRVNQALADMNRSDPQGLIGRAIFDVVPALRGALEPKLRAVLQSGEPLANVPVESLPRRPGRGKRFWLNQFYPVADDVGAITGVGIVCEEITQRRQAEEARDLLGRELSHRIKNLFAVVASLITLSARGNEATERFARVMRGRLEALGRAQDYVRPLEWGDETAQPRTLHSFLAALLAPYRDEAGVPRVRISGDDISIGPSAATAIALTFHELATNASKYGSLSAPQGHVELVCSMEGSMEIRWRERGGPTIDGPPGQEGFGSLLARRSVTGDLGGTLAMDWAKQGLEVCIAVPLTRLGH